jgi:hypothetical protein
MKLTEAQTVEDRKPEIGDYLIRVHPDLPMSSGVVVEPPFESRTPVVCWVRRHDGEHYAVYPAEMDMWRYMTARGDETPENMRTHKHLVKAIEYCVVAARETGSEYNVFFDHDDDAWGYSRANGFSERTRIVISPSGECKFKVTGD